MKITELVLCFNRFLSIQRFRNALEVFSTNPELVSGSLNESGNSCMVIFRIHMSDSWYPTTTMSEIAFLNDVTSEFTATVILRWFPGQSDRLTSDFLVSERSFRWLGFVQHRQLETAFVDSTAVRQHQRVLFRIGSFCIDYMNDRVVSNRGDCSSIGRFYRFGTNAPGYFWNWFAYKVDVHVEDASSLDTHVVEWSFDLGSH